MMSMHLYVRSLEHSVQFSSVLSLSRVQLFGIPRIAACQASLVSHNKMAGCFPGLSARTSVSPLLPLLGGLPFLPVLL